MVILLSMQHKRKTIVIMMIRITVMGEGDEKLVVFNAKMWKGMEKRPTNGEIKEIFEEKLKKGRGS